MNKDYIILMAEKSGFQRHEIQSKAEEFEYFAHLVAAAEREACAAVCDKLNDEYADANPADCAFAIRERGAP